VLASRHNVRTSGSLQPHGTWSSVYPSLRRRLLQLAHTWICSSTPPLSWNTRNQDAAPPTGRWTCARTLNATFPGSWKTRDGPTHCPPRSPDITPLDFFLWGYVKDTIYANVRDLQDALARIVSVLSLRTCCNGSLQTRHPTSHRRYSL
jgi:hypothetical protein